MFKRDPSQHPVLDVIKHHLYVCHSKSEELRRHLAFRNYLRNHRGASIAYENLKRDIARQAGQDKTIYVELKEEQAGEFIEEILAKALRIGVQNTHLESTKEIHMLTDIRLTSDPRVKEVFDQYPPSVRPQMDRLRELILEVASETETVDKLEETLKWGEPSYLNKHGSTIRIDWKSRDPECYAIYFKCTSQLVPTFRTLYPDLFHFEGNRAIIFNLNEPVPKVALKHCIRLALTYHKVKHQPMLGA